MEEQPVACNHAPLLRALRSLSDSCFGYLGGWLGDAVVMACFPSIMGYVWGIVARYSGQLGFPVSC